MDNKRSTFYHGMSWLFLCLAISFMLGLFAPIDAYVANSQEYWFSLQQLLPVTLFVAVAVFLVLYGVAFVFRRTKAAPYIYGIMLGLFVYLYIQGNYIPRDYGVLDGKEINWNQYKGYAIASIIVALVCLIGVIYLLLKHKEGIYKIGKWISVFILIILIPTMIISITHNVEKPQNEEASYIVTDKDMLNLSVDNNIIVFLLDTYDGALFNALLEEDYDKYSDAFQNFTYYKDTLGAYPTTDGAMPHILTGIRYKNEQPYSDYVDGAYEDNIIYETFDANNYSLGIYTVSQYLSPQKVNYVNVMPGTYSISDYTQFVTKLYRLIGFNYLPHQLKKYLFIDTSAFSDLKRTNIVNEAYSENVQKFYEHLCNNKIDVQHSGNCFRFYHLEGTHPQFTFGENMVSDPKMSYTCFDEAAGNCTLLIKYFNILKELEIYDNSTIIVMADHGYFHYSQNPLFLIKNKNERHPFVISRKEMSYDFLKDIWVSLAEGKTIDEKYIEECKTPDRFREFLYYKWSYLSQGKDYLPEMWAMYSDGVAYESDNMIATGDYFSSGDSTYAYNLGDVLYFTGKPDEATAIKYCVFGFSGSEGTGTWTDGKVALMRFEIQEEYDNLQCVITADPFKDSTVTTQDAIVYVNDHYVTTLSVSEKKKEAFVIPKEYVKDKTVILKLELPNAVPSGRQGQRKLALWMQSISISSTHDVVDSEIN